MSDRQKAKDWDAIYAMMKRHGWYASHLDDINLPADVEAHIDEIANNANALQARLEAAERERNYAVASRDLWWDQLTAAQARIAELEKPVTDEETAEIEDCFQVRLASARLGNEAERKCATACWEQAILDLNRLAIPLIRRLSRQSKSNALLGKCEEALKKHLLCNVHRMAHGGGTVHVGVRCDGCDAEAENLAALVHEPTCILSQIEQSKDIEVKETR